MELTEAVLRQILAARPEPAPRPRASPEAMRLYWALTGPTSLWVMRDEYYDDDESLEPYIRVRDTSAPGAETLDQADVSVLHAISQAPLTEPRIMSASVSVWILDNWEDMWYDIHHEHWEGGDEPPEGEEIVLYGRIPGYEIVPDDDVVPGKEHLLRCCGEDRPLNKQAKLEVKSQGEFLTVHEFVSAVHPWLLGLRGEILGGLGMRFPCHPRPNSWSGIPVQEVFTYWRRRHGSARGGGYGTRALRRH